MSAPCIAWLAFQVAGFVGPQHEIQAPVPIPQQRVWVVDEAGGGDFLDVQPAIDAAAGGDLVVIKPGDFGQFTIQGKGVSVVGTGGVFNGSLIVEDIPAGAFVALRNFATHLSLVAKDVGGVLWIEEAVVGSLFGASTALNLTDVEECVVVRSSMGWLTTLFGGGHGVSATRSSLHLFESKTEGYRGRSCSGSGSLNGGNGVAAVDAFVLAFDSDLIGGRRGSAFDSFFNCLPAGTAGISFSVVNSTAYELSSTFPNGVSGSVSVFQGQPRSLRAPALVEEGTPALLTITGPPGDSVFTLLAPAPEVLFAPILYGSALTGTQPVVMAQGTIPSGGVLSIELELPPLPAKDEFQAWVIQSLQTDPLNSYISSGSILHVVEAGVL